MREFRAYAAEDMRVSMIAEIYYILAVDEEDAWARLELRFRRFPWAIIYYLEDADARLG